MNEKIQPKDYYDFFPPNFNRTGDIWRCLPNPWGLKKPHFFGLTVTPACDLEQRKTETITYLPIISVREYLNSNSFYFEIWQDVFAQISKLKMTEIMTPPDRYELPLLEEITEIKGKLFDLKENDQSKAGSFDRICMYEKYIKQNSSGGSLAIEDVGRIFLSGNFDKILKKIVKNSFKVDIHFLPADEKPIYSSAVPDHSIVLFRHATSMPIQIINSIQYSNDEDWPNKLQELRKYYPIAKLLTDLPIRLATLRGDFLSDLLSRYVNMQIRLGSRDFTDDTVDQYADQLRRSK
ncbi:hypothetical protein [Massilia sp. YIM B04103]|uniref:hypothetical protein n=1 Tax=Massilia sp. YIM B04103 TaxID=2963106 RepID=UPI0021088C53|nr:hypothetical protein [Massilia sp. YIM B04103]